MIVVCLDLEGVLVPEIWHAIAAATKIDALKLTTRDMQNYSELMRHRIKVLTQHTIFLRDIQKIIASINPLQHALEFLNQLRVTWQVIIVSDTFTQFARPLMQKLNWPTLFCNELIVKDDVIVDFQLRQNDGKKNVIKSLQAIGYVVYASGDSYNDLGMIQEADGGSFYNPPSTIVTENPSITVCQSYADLRADIAQFAEQQHTT